MWSLYIENADATPPHLKVFPAVGELSGFAWFCEVLCDGWLSLSCQKVSIVELSSFLISFDRTQVEVSLCVKVCMTDPMISCVCCLGSPNLTTKRCQHWHAYFKQFG